MNDVSLCETDFNIKLNIWLDPLFQDFAGDFEKSEEKLQENFMAILKDLEDYLQPVTSYLEPVIR